jgi:AraC-like DNA-binding protein
LDGLIVADLDDAPATLLMHVEKAEARSVASVLRPAIAVLKPTVRDAVLAAVTRAHERLTPEAFARLLAVPRRLLTRRLTEAGFPAPHRLLTWGRLIVAAHMLEDVHRSADGVAQVLDFPSGSAFRNTCQRYLHATPQQIRERGGAAYVIKEFMQNARGSDTEVGGAPPQPANGQHADGNGSSPAPRRLTPMRGTAALNGNGAPGSDRVIPSAQPSGAPLDDDESLEDDLEGLEDESEDA